MSKEQISIDRLCCEADSVKLLLNLNNTIFIGQVTYDQNQIKQLFNQCKIFVLSVNRTPVGYVAIGGCYNIFTKSVVSTIVSIGVLKEYRSRGFGTVLLKYAININGNLDLYLNVREENKQLQKLYGSQGFQIVGNIEKYYKFPSGMETATCMIRKGKN